MCTYRGQLISTGGTPPWSRRQKRKGREALSYVIFTPPCLLIYLALPIPSYALATPLMTSPFYPHCRHIYLYTIFDSSTRLFFLSLFSHPPPVPSISAPSFLRACLYVVYEPHISAYKTAGASFCLLRDNYRRSLRRRLHPKAVIPVGVIDSRNFRTKTATRNRIDFVVASR